MVRFSSRNLSASVSSSTLRSFEFLVLKDGFTEVLGFEDDSFELSRAMKYFNTSILLQRRAESILVFALATISSLPGSCVLSVPRNCVFFASSRSLG